MSNLFIVLSSEYTGFLDIFLDIISLFSILFGIYVINSKNPIVSVLFLIGLFISISLNLILLGYNFIGLSYLLVYVGAVSILFLFILMLINVRISELLNDTSNSIPLAIFTGFSFGFPIYQTLNHIDSIEDNYKYLDLSSLLNSEYLHEDIINEHKAEDTSNKNIHNLDNKLEKKQDNLNNQENTININKHISETTNNNEDLELYYNINYLDRELLEDELYFAVSNSWDNNLIEFSDITSVGNILYSTYGIWLIICSIILLLAMIGAITITKKEKN